MATIKCIEWDDANYDWNSVDYNWDEFCVVSAVYNSGNTLDEIYDAVHVLSEQDKEIFIRLLCRIKDIDIEKVAKVTDIKIEVDDVKLVLNKVIGVKFIEVK